MVAKALEILYKWVFFLHLYFFKKIFHFFSLFFFCLYEEYNPHISQNVTTSTFGPEKGFRKGSRVEALAISLGLDSQKVFSLKSEILVSNLRFISDFSQI